MCLGMANGGKTPSEMTPQEVYDRLYARYVFIAEGIFDSYEITDKLFEALEKQIPKKPLHKELINCGFAWEWTCPNCRIVKVTTEKTFCDDCGQALDWEDE